MSKSGGLNLGCGHDQPLGWHNVDVDESVDPDEVVDLNETPWPWDDDEWVHIQARHVFEHLDAVPWDELVRVMAPNATLEVAYPIGHTRFEDITHRRYWGYQSAAQLAGERDHAHEGIADLRLVSRDVDWSITEPEPLVQAYGRYRLWVSGPGPWLEQMPGLYGEIEARYRWEP